MLTLPVRTVRVLLTAAMLAASLFVVMAAPAHADVKCWLDKVETEDGITWEERCEDSGGDDGIEDDGDSGTEIEPQCDLSVFDGKVHDGATRWCKGDVACWGNFPSVLPEERWDDQTGEPRPSPDHIMTYVKCEDTEGEWGWYLPPDETGPSVWDLAWSAFGALTTPAFEPAFSPPTRSIVNLDTWYWADGPGSDPLTSSSGHVTAIAEPSHLQVDPGDGSSALTCDFETAENERCIHAYARASVGHADGYPLRMRLVYDVRFEQNGSPLELDGLPTALESAWEQASLPVAEVQALVTR